VVTKLEKASNTVVILSGTSVYVYSLRNTASNYTVNEKYYIQINVLPLFLKYIFLKLNREISRNRNNVAQNTVLCGGGYTKLQMKTLVTYHYRNKPLPTIHRSEIGETQQIRLGGVGSSITARYSGRTRF
jgi:hypothetical protein